MIEEISVIGAREHNLKNISVRLPKNKLIVITGLSGSGKSSLAFDTIYAEGQRRYVESLSAYARQFLELMPKPDVDSITGLSPAISIEQKTVSKNPRSTVGTVTEIYDYLRVLFARIGTPYSPVTGLPIEAQTKDKMVDKIMALGERERFYILAPVVRGKKGEFHKEIASLKKQGYSRVKVDGVVLNIDELQPINKNKKHDIFVVIDRLELENTEDFRVRVSQSLESALIVGDGVCEIELVNSEERIVFSSRFSCPESGFSIEEIEPRLFSFNSPFGACRDCGGLGFEGGASVSRMLFFHSGGKLQSNEEDDSSCRNEKCESCAGYRLRPEALCVKISGFHIGDVCDMSIQRAFAWCDDAFNKLSAQNRSISERLFREIRERLQFLIRVGLEYLTLGRSSGTLSGGEGQRIRLASQIGSGLTGTLYVLDEPSIGLHQRDNERLINTLKSLRDIGNTVIVVEHDEDAIRSADHVIDMGPRAGGYGGNVVAEGPPSAIEISEKSLTGAYLRKEASIEIPQKRREGCGREIRVLGARLNNLKNLSIGFPLGKFVCVTGVSGGGKSSLVIDTLYRGLGIIKRAGSFSHEEKEALRTAALRAKSAEEAAMLARRKIEMFAEKMQSGRCDEMRNVVKCDSIEGTEFIESVIEVSQTPIGRTPHSTPATYIGAFTPIREWFASLPEAKARGYGIGRFSFNTKGGRCESCDGKGVRTIEMHFLPDVEVVCESCKGLRYSRDTLEVRYRGKSIADILNMPVTDALELFSAVPSVANKLRTLVDVGLGYITVGQRATTISGGEAQRVKLSKELCKRSTDKTLYILDEPTTGLHFEDIRMLLGVLHKFVDKGSSVIVIEHNLDVIKTADWVIDIGPEGGELGGRVVAEGAPEDIAKCINSYTGRFLAKYLKR
ncbi:excinuclease ABC subunit UvrA [Candidatus Hydrogenosomobacter endosymbioticus]|uniref:UvrABC system protein A n=1 Tax=Candidatus Hydrogenosomobacter endosymbioticus TaxID=2558174 RepID=A0ABM7V9W4_9PROT|nr:ABC-ATPase UvrA [Candidatus Hydrogenosomobacter endosymbioticus]BDB96571.1 hypothetical protein HYD_7040 [Candidatus Hydrogenosomobacter endosymbioticus]